MDDRAIVNGHAPRAQLVQSMIDGGLSAQDIMTGVVLTHREYLALFEAARKALREGGNDA